MNLPKIRNKKRSTTFIQDFQGYNHNLRTAQGEFFDMKNISLEHYPVIATRHGEVDRLSLPGNPNGLHEYVPDTLMAVCGDVLYVGITDSDDGHAVEGSAEVLEDSEKSFATIGAYTVIMPDKVVYNSQTGELKQIEKNFESSEDLKLQVIPCDIEGKTHDYVESETAPVDTSLWWYDTVNEIWKKYSTSSDSWVQAETTYVKLLPTGADKKGLSDYFGTFLPLETVSLAFSQTGELTDYVIFGTGEDDGDHFLVIIDASTAKTSEFHLKNKCPDLEHIVSLNNRVWGVSNETHELFACKLGNPMQWYNYAGIASDSYAVSLGYADLVTASAAYNNYIHFFTEDKIIKIYGDYPSNYQVHTTKADGVIKNGADTVVQVEGILFWVSPIGVVAYDGSLPYFRGQKFSPHFLDGKTVAAGRDGTMYCLSVSENGTPVGVFEFDTKNGMWAVGGDQIYVKTATMNNALCVLNKDSRIITHYDREIDHDVVVTKSDNIFSIDREEETFAGHITTLDETKFYSGMDEEGNKISGINGVIIGESVVTYYSEYDPSVPAGVGYPIQMKPETAYEITYKRSAEKDSMLFVAFFDEEYNFLESYNYEKLIPDMTNFVTPKDTAWGVLVFGRRSDGIASYRDIELREYSEPMEEEIEWFLETGNLGLDTPNQKYISRIQLRVDFQGTFKAEIAYDNEDYKTVLEKEHTQMHSITIPIKVVRNDHFRIRLSGVGQMKVYSFGYETSEGSGRCLL